MATCRQEGERKGRVEKKIRQLKKGDGCCRVMRVAQVLAQVRQRHELRKKETPRNNDNGC